jgi:hypothetical protein
MSEKFTMKQLSYRKFDEEFLRKLARSVKANDQFWFLISQYQDLPSDFINQYRNKLGWHSISEFQNLSEPFMLNHINYLKLDRLRKNKKIPEPIKNRIISLITINNLK